MDIRKFSVSPTARLHLRDAADELMYADDAHTQPMAVNVYGPGSRQHARAQAAQHNRMLDKLKRKGKAAQTAEELAQEKAEFLADCTESFEHVECGDSTGRQLALDVYTDPSVGFIADQVAKFLGEWANFTKGSATS